MKRCNHEAVLRPLVLAMMLACSVMVAWADVDPSRYSSIVERNPFGLKPPPPPADPNANAPAPPPPPPATVELTGIISGLQANSPKKALLEIIPGPGKQLIRRVWNEGEREDSVELVSIDVVKGEVVIKNGNLVTNIALKVAKSGGPAPTPPGQLPGASVVSAKPVFPGQQTPPNFGGSASGSGGRGSIMTGGNPSYQETTQPTQPTVNPAPVTPTTSQPSNPGFRSIPSRTIRTGGLTPPSMAVPGQPFISGPAQPQQVPPTQPAEPPVDPAQAYLNTKAQAEWARQHRIIMPPAPTIPGVE